ncbi:tail fiber domain-containing protein [Candidatus Kaiserbacteria bacterium]|nr:MAG: tail fiber domain-containing protein [Candidatus Kaiserbacteria bacterium]
MSKHLTLDNKKYLSSDAAGKAAGYTPDYIGKMCREGSVSCRRIGRAWFVEETSLKEHIVRIEHARVVRKEELSKERKDEYKTPEIAPAQKILAQKIAAHAKQAKEIAEEVYAANKNKVEKNLVTPIVSKAKSVQKAVSVHKLEQPITGTYFRKRLLETGAAADGLRQEVIVRTPIVPANPVYTFVQKSVALITAVTLVFSTSALSHAQYRTTALDTFEEEIIKVASVFDALPNLITKINTDFSNSVIALDDFASQPAASVLGKNVVAQVSALDLFGKVYVNVQGFFAGVNADIGSSLMFVHSGNSRGRVELSVKAIAQNNTDTPQITVTTTPNTDALYVPIQQTGSGNITNVINQPVVERVVETQRIVTQSGVSLVDLQQLENELRQEIVRVSTRNAGGVAGNFHAVALTQRIDNLGDVDISNSRITNTSVAATTLSVNNAATFGDNVSIAGNLSVTGATSLGGALTVNDFTATGLTTLATTTITELTVNNATATNFVATDAVLTNATSTNFYTSLITAITGAFANLTADDAILTNATTTNLVATNSANLATTTITDATITTGNITDLLTTNATTANLFATSSVLVNATSTNFFSSFLSALTAEFTNVTAVNATSTNTFTTNLTATEATFTNATTTDFVATNSATLATTTITNLAANDTTSGTLIVSGNSNLATTTITDATITTGVVTDLTATNATSTNLVATGTTTLATTTIASLSLGSLTGFLKATAGSVATSLIDLTADVTGVLPDANVADDLTITAGTIENTPIGAATPSTGVFTNATSTNLVATNSVFTNATSTNFYTSLFTSLTSIFTNLTATNATTTNLVATNSANLATTTVTGSLTVNGNANIIGDTSSDTLTVNASINSDLIPDVNAVRDLGSPSYYWDEIYADNINVNSISAASTTIGGTSNNSFTINTDNASVDTEDSNLVFFRGTVVPNAVVKWDSTSERFDINQPFFIQNDSSTTTVPTLHLVGSNTQTAPIFVADDFSGSRVLTVGVDGNIGIGTTSPSEKLHIYGGNIVADRGGSADVQRTVTIGGAKQSAGADYGRLDFQNWDNNDASPENYIGARISSENESGAEYGDLRFSTSNGTLDTQMIINGAGNVGIGTTTPGSKLHIDGDLQLNDGADIAWLSNIRPIVSGGSIRLENSAGTELLVAQSDGDIEIAGNVGIGTAAPALAGGGTGLHINATSFPELKLTNGTTGTLAADGSLIQGNGLNLAIINREAGAILFSTSNTEVARFDSSGNFGIGVTPSYPLDVVGVTRASGGFRTNSETITDFTGTGLTLNSGSLETTLGTSVDLTTEVTGVLPVTNGGTGTTTLNNLITLGTHTTGNYLATLADAGNAFFTVSNSGTESAAVTLDIVNDSLNFAQLSDSLVVDTTTTFDLDTNSADLNFDSNTLYIDSSTNRVGIGTGSPGRKLDVLSTTGIADIGLSTNDTDNSFIRMASDADGTPRYGFIGVDYSEDNLKITRDGFDGSSKGIVINNLGNVGIGTTTPAEKLTVAGTARITGNTILESALTLSALTGGILTTNSSGVVSTTTIDASVIDADTLDFTEFKDALTVDATTTFDLDTNSADLNFDANTLVIDSSTNRVGVGVASPVATLDVSGNLRATGAPSMTASGAGVELGYNGYGFVQAYDRGASSYKNLWLEGAETYINPSTGGNVGIGTTSPNSKLHVEADSSGTVNIASFFNTNADDNDVDFIAIGQSAIADDALVIGYNEASNFGYLNVWGEGAGDGIVIADGGNVGIGTTSPASALDVWGDLRVGTSSTPALFADVSSGNVGIGDSTPSYALDVAGSIGLSPDNSHIYFSNQNTYIGENSNSHKLELRGGGSNNTQTVYIDNTGQLGLGNAAPSYKLDVSGTARITGNTILESALTLSALTGGILTTNSSGVVSTTTVDGADVTADTLDFTEFKDALALDASTDIAADGTEVLSITNTGTGNSFVVNDSASDTTPFIIDSNGSVGIQATPDSEYKLDVRNPGTTVLVGVHSNSTGRPAGIEFGTGSATNNYGFVGYDGSTINFGSVYAFGVDTTISNRGTEYIRLTGGNVGIGTTTPDGTLHVFDTGNADILAERSGGAKVKVQAQASAGQIGTQTSHPLQLITNAGARLTIDTSGNVGIGTTSPASALDVWGDLRVGTSSTPTLFTDVSSGNVGINTATPALGLTIAQNADDNGLRVYGYDDRSTRYGEFYVDATGYLNVNALVNGYIKSNGADLLQWGSGFLRVNNNTPLRFGSGTDYSVGYYNVDDTFRITDGTDLTSTPRLTLDNTGNVGIGTTTPSGKLHVTSADQLVSTFERTSGSGYTQVDIKANVAGDTGNSVLTFSDTSGSPGLIDYEHANDSLAFSTSGSEALRIDASGNVGIGTTTPAEKLHVSEGDILLDNNQFLKGSLASGFDRNLIGYDATENLIIGHSGTSVTGDVNIYAGTASKKIGFFPDGATEAVRITDSGNVGIGTTSPVANLAVVGEVLATTGFYSENTTITGGTPFGILVGGADDSTNIFDIAAGGAYGKEGGWIRFPRGGVGTNASRAWIGSTYTGNYGDDIRIYSSKLGNNNQTATSSALNAVFRQDYVSLHTGSAGASDTSERLRITSAGNVGIGTSTPGNMNFRTNLDIAGGTYGGAVTIYGDDAATKLSGWFDSGTPQAAKFGTQSSHQLDLMVGNTERLSIDTSGNVGIGTSTPEAKLVVWDSTDVSSSGGGALRVGASNTDFIAIDNNEIQAIGSGVASSLYLNTDGGTVFIHDATDGVFAVNSDDLYVTGAGNVGIGTTTPASKLDVWGDLRVGTSSTPALFTDVSSGNVGIGTASPSQKLIVYQASAGTPAVIETDGGFTALQLKTGTGLVNLVATGGDFNVQTGGAERFRITNTGNIGIGTTTPANQLTTTGSVQFAALTGGILTTNSSGVVSTTTIDASLIDADTLDFTEFKDALTVDATTTFDLDTNSADLDFDNNTLYIDSSANMIGIGDPTPSNKLDVQGALRVGSGYNNVVAPSNGAIIEGNVGIGTTGPGAKLDVEGDVIIATGLNVGGDLGAATGTIYAYDGVNGGNFGKDSGDLFDIRDGQIFVRQNDNWEYQFLTSDFSPYFNDANDLGTASKQWQDLYTIDGFFSGNIGIGTTTPEETLHIYNSDPSVKLTNASSPSSYRSVISHNWDTNNGFGIYSGTNLTQVMGAANNVGTVFFPNGNVSIGTTSASYKLDVHNENGGVLARFKDSDSVHEGIIIAGDVNGGWIGNNALATGEGFYIQDSLNGIRTYAGGVEVSRALATSYTFNELGADIDFRVEGVGEVNALFVEGSSGNVGIGTASPDTALEILSTDQPQFQITYNSTNKAAFQRSGGDFKLQVSDSGGTLQDRLTVNESGNIGIGTTNPDSILTGTALSISTQGARTTGDGIGSLNFITNDASYTGTYADGIGAEISAISDSATGAAYGLAFTTGTITSSNRAERLRITSTGNVGIGTTTPLGKLHISSAVSGAPAVSSSADELVVEGIGPAGISIVGGTSSDTSIFFGDSGSQTMGRIVYDNNANDLSLWTTATERLTIDSSGNVGIGTTTPDATLSIYETAVANPLRVYSNTYNAVALFNSSDNNAVITISDDDTTSYLLAEDGYTSIGGNNALDAGNLNINNTSGNVGIGTTTPEQKLEVVGGNIQIDNNQYLKSRLTTGTSVNLIGYNSGNQTIVGANAEVKLDGTATLQPPGNIVFQPGGTSDINATLDSDTDLNVGSGMLFVEGNTGNVGIGTTTPDSLLHVAGVSKFGYDGIGLDSSLVQLFGGSTTSGNQQSFSFEVGDTGLSDLNTKNLVVRGASGSSDIAFSPSTSYPGLLMLDGSTGNVGIGTTSPASTLDVWGDLRVGTSSTPALFTDVSSGNVGIGTASPSSKLDISGSGALLEVGTALTINDASTYGLDSNQKLRITRNDPGIVFKESDASNQEWFVHSLGGNFSLRDLTAGSVYPFTVQAGAGQDSLLVQSDGDVIMNQGNVGIGTDSPSTNLQVVQSGTAITASAQTVASFQRSGDTIVSIISSPTTKSFLDFGDTDSAVMGRIIYDNVGNGFSFRTNGVNDQMVVTSAGNVGIGTTNPSSKLDVLGYINTSNGYKLEGNTILQASTTTGSLFVGNTGNTTHTGNENTALGTSALSSLTTGTKNVAVGYQALENATSTASNVAIGYRALRSSTAGGAAYIGGSSIAIGVQSGMNNTTGFANSFLGANAGLNNTTGNANVFLGYYTGIGNIDGSSNVAIGGLSNAIGTLRFNTSPDSVVAVGAAAAAGLSNYYNEGGTYVGTQSGYSAATSSNYNTFLGFKSGYGVTTGSNNTIIGAATLSGAQNQITSGANNISIGYNVAVPSATANNQLVIGNLIYGTGLDGTQSTLSSGNVGIGTSSPASKLDVWGDFRVGTSSTPALFADVSNGNVGIGTSTLAGWGLSVKTGISSGDAVRIGTPGGYPGLAFFDNAGDQEANIGVHQTTGDLHLWTNSASDLVIDSTGNVGIGTTSPQALLHLYKNNPDLAIFQGSDLAGYITYKNNSNALVGYSGYATPGQVFSDALTNAMVIRGEYAVQFGTGSGSDLTINSSGNVGIGTTTPTTKLSVNGALSLASTTPATTVNALYNVSGSLYWNGSAVGSGAALFTDGGTTTYLTSLTDDLAIGGTTSDAPLFFDESASALSLNPFGTSAGNTGEVRFEELEANGDNYVALKAPDAITSNTTFTLPTADGTAGQFLTTDASGNLSFATAGDGISPSFSVHRNNVAQSIPGNTWTKVAWTTEHFDTNSDFASDRFTPTVAGKYLLTTKTRFESVSDSDQTYMAIYKNGALYSSDYKTSTGTFRTNQVSVVVDANGTTDYFEVYVHQSSASNKDINGWSAYTSFTGSRIDGGNGLWTHNSPDISYTAGNVGIGTTTPTEKLDVIGVVRSGNDSRAGFLAGPRDSSGSNAWLYNPTGDDGRLFIDGAGDVLTFTNTGNVGIGTTTPATKLQLVENGSNGSIVNLLTLDTNTQNVSVAGSGQIISFQGSSDVYSGAIGGYGDGSNGGIGIWGGGTISGNPELYVNDAGNVGIGTTTPSAKVWIYDSSAGAVGSPISNGDELVLESSGNTGLTIFNTASSVGSVLFGDPSDNDIGRIQYDHATDRLFFSAGAANIMHLVGGNVGIGDSTPDHKLDVAGNIGLTASSYINWGDTTGTTGYGFRDNAGTIQYKNNAGAWTDFSASSGGGWTDGGTDVYLATGTDNVGIGTATPARDLDLSTTGQITFGDNVTTDGSQGIYWHTASGYGIYRTAGAWTANTYQQLQVSFATGIVLDPGSGVYDRSHVGVIGGVSIGDSYYTTELDNGLAVQGSVGIGTTTPSQVLDVQGNINVTGSIIADAGTHVLRLTDNVNTVINPITAGGSVYLNWDEGSTGGGIKFGDGAATVVGSVSRAGDLQLDGALSIDGTGNNYLLGNVGIGTTTPESKLSVNLGSNDSTVNFAVSGVSPVLKNTITTTGTVARQDLSSITMGVGSTASSNYQGYLTFSTTPSAGSLTERMRILEGGNVGIGIDTPDTKLHVEGTSISSFTGTSDGVLRISSPYTANYFNSIDFAGASGSSAVPLARIAAKITPSGTELHFGTSNSYGSGITNDAIVIDPAGEVGIGVTNPTYKLQLNGQPAANGYTAWTNYSDRRLKENITELSTEDTTTLERISELRPVTYNYNELTGYDEETRSRRISGFIAQELKVTFPEMVGTTTINGTEYFDTNLSDLPLYLIQAIKELWVIVQENTKRIAELIDWQSSKDIQIAALEERLVAVEAQLAGVASATTQTEATSTTTSTPPTLTLIGTNPAEIALNANYSDLGITAQDADGNDLSITLTLNGEAVTTIDIDTTTDATHTITYSATDTNEQTATIERTVIVGTGTPTEEPVVEDTATSTPAVVIEDDTATSTDPVIVEEEVVEDTTATSTEPVVNDTTEPVVEETVEEEVVEDTVDEVIEPVATDTPAEETATTTDSTI